MICLLSVMFGVELQAYFLCKIIIFFVYIFCINFFELLVTLDIYSLCTVTFLLII